MKLLYIASERSRAHLASRAIRPVFPHATVLWASGHERAAFGILENPDLAALIVEVQSDSHGCSYLKHLQQLGVNAAIIMVLPEGAAAPLKSLETGAQGYVAKGPSFSQELPAVVARTIEAARDPGGLRRDHLRSETVAKSAGDVRSDRHVHQAFSHPGQARQPLDAPAMANRTPHQNFDARSPDALGNTLERRVSDLEALFHQRQQSWGLEQSAAAERQAELKTLLHQEREIRTGLEQALAEAKVALQAAEQRLASASSAAAAQLAERQAQYETGMARATAMREMLEGQLRESRTSYHTALADVERLSRREAELSSMLTAASAANEFGAHDQQATAEQAAAREAELQAQLARELEQRRNAEDELSRAKTALDDAEKQRASAVTVATALMAKRQAQFEAELAKAAEARDLQEALDEARQTVHAHAAIVEEFTQREAALRSQLDEAAAAERTLAQRLTEAARELEAAREGAARDHLAAETRAAEREAALDGLIHQERATRGDVEQELAQVETALAAARRDHAAAVKEVERFAEREAAVTAQLDEAAAIRRTLERQLTDAARALQDAHDGASRDRLAAETRAAEREAALDGLIHQERAIRREVEEQLAQVEAALAAAKQQHTLAMAAAAAERAERQSQFEIELSQTAARRDEFEQRFTDAETALATARHDHAAAVNEIGRFAERETALTRRLAETAAREAAAAAERAECEAQFAIELSQTAARRDEFEQRFTHAETLLAEAKQQHASALAAAETRSAERETALDGLIRQERAMRGGVEQQLAQVETALEGARRDHAAALQEVKRLGARETALTTQLAEGAERVAALDGLIRQERARRDDIEQQLTHVEAALAEAKQQHAAAMAAAATERAERQTQFEMELSQMAARRDEFEQRFTHAETLLAEAKQHHTSTLAAAEARSAEREAALDRVVHRERALRGGVEQQLAHVEAALAEAKQQHAAAMAAAAAERAERQTQFEIELSQTAARRDEFEQRFTDAETLLAEAKQHHASALAAAETRSAAREAALDGLIHQERALRGGVEQRLAHVEAALADAKQQHAAAMVAAATERAERHTQFEIELSQMATRRDEFEQRFIDAETARAAARRDHAAAVKEIERLAERETVLATQLAEAAERAAALDGVIHQERAMRGDVEQQLAQVGAALAEAKQQHASVMAAAEVERAERQAQFDIQLSQTALRRDEFKQRFTDAEAARAAARRDHAAAVKEVERLAERETALTTQLAETAQREAALDGLLHQERAIRADVEQQLVQETTQRDALTRAVADLRAAGADADQRFREEIASLTARARDEVTHLESQFAREREDYAERQAELISEIRDLEAARDALDESLASVREQSRRREMDHHNERDALERARVTAEAEIRRLAAQRIETHHQLEEARRDFQETLDRVSTEHAEAVAKLVTAVGERDALINEQATQHAAFREGAEHHRSQLQEGFHTTLTARAREIERLQDTLDRTNKELAGARKRCEILQTEANRVQPLENQLEEHRSALRRQFQDAPLAWCRFTRDGALTQTNRALADLAGYRKLDEVRGDDFVKTVFESASDLSWLIERCLSTKRRQSIETAWKRRNGDRLLVRLSGRESAPDVVEIAVEDITTLRALEDRVGQAHRMEAVGRLASEIAVTCGRMLQDAYEDGRRWLMAVGEDEALRHRAEMLLDEVTRAASYLQQLAAYGDEQTSALQPVELNRVLRNLKPVLKHVAGDDVDLELSKVSSPLNVDMRADRVERLLVNLASYGRERMPSGGRLKIELATVFVDQSFIADHPAVRRGSHALITVTAMRRDMPAPGLLQLQTAPTGPRPNDVTSPRPGVELGPLQELLRQCGGHLWMTADPPGNMVAKIRVPLRVSDDRRAQPRRIFRPVARA